MAAYNPYFISIMIRAVKIRSEIIGSTVGNVDKPTMDLHPEQHPEVLMNSKQALTWTQSLR
jgi:hypothetical protein